MAPMQSGLPTPVESMEVAEEPRTAEPASVRKRTTVSRATSSAADSASIHAAAKVWRERAESPHTRKVRYSMRRVSRDLSRGARRSKRRAGALEFITESVEESIKSALPYKFIRRSGPFSRYFFGFSLYAILLAIFIYFLYYNYTTYYNGLYLSDTFDIDSCITIGRAISGTFIGGYDGKWRLEGDAGNTQGLYKIVFYNFKVDSKEEFRAFMESVEEKYIKPIDVIMKNQTLSRNLLYLMCYQVDIIQNGYNQSFSFTGEPRAVFNVASYHVQLASYNKTCGYQGVKRGSFGKYEFFYDRDGNNDYAYSTQYSDVDLYFTYNSSLYTRNRYGYSPCNEIAPSDMTYQGFTFYLDMESISTALAINHGILDPSYLSVLSEEKFRAEYPFTYKGVSYFFFFGTNNRFPDAKPLPCYRYISGDDSSFNHRFETYCLHAYNNVDSYYGIPLLDTYGYYDEDRYHRCTCPSASGQSDCALFDFLGGILMFPVDDGDLSDQLLMDLITGYTPEQLDEYGYVAARHAHYLNYKEYWEYRAEIRKGLSKDSWGYYYRGYTLEESDPFAFCNNSCTVASFELYKNYDSMSLKVVSTALYDLSNFTTSCSGGLVLSPNWHRLAASPPTDVTERYYSCRPTIQESLLYALGTSHGTIQLMYLPVLLLVVTPMMYLLLRTLNMLPQRELYSEDERQSVLTLLSELVLEERDGVDSGADRDDPARQLASALLQRAKSLRIDEPVPPSRQVRMSAVRPLPAAGDFKADAATENL